MNERRTRWLFTALAVVACGEPGSGRVDPHAFERPDAKVNAEKAAELRRKWQIGPVQKPFPSQSDASDSGAVV